MSNEISDSLSAPLGDVIASVARGVADAQQAMDMRTIETYRELYSGDDQLRAELQVLGYQPTWYRIPEVNAEVTISLSISEQSSVEGSAVLKPSTGPRSVKLYAAPIDANYANRYNYDLKAASKISFKIVPVPPSAQAEQMQVVPNLKGKDLQQVESLLGILNISFEVEGKGTVEKTEPEAGSILRSGSALTVTFS